MVRFKILHGFRLKAANRILLPKSLYSTEDEAEIAELRDVFAPHGACEEVKSVPAEAPKAETKTVDPNDDITIAKGVGKGLSVKLAEKGITTFSGLKAAMTDKAREAEMQELLGTSYAKVMENFVTPES